MSSLPPDASKVPQSADSGTDDDAAVPRWAVPAVPPPWSGTGQAAPGAQPPNAESSARAAEETPGRPVQPPTPDGPPPWAQPGFGQAAPAWAQPGFAPVAARAPLFDRQKWLPTICVAAVIAVVVLGGIGLDKVIAAPSAGIVNVGDAVTITAASGWILVDTSDSGGGVELQKANVELTIAATPYTGTADAALQDAEQALSADAAQISFGDPVDKPIGGHVAAAAGFEAIVSGSSGSGTVDGELVCVIDGGDAVEFVVATSQGDLSSVTDDLKAMISSVEVGR
jgi:hypothetical protein